MQILSVIQEFCDNNKSTWTWYHDYTEEGHLISVGSKTLKEGYHQATFYEHDVIGICIESNQLCIAIKPGIMVWCGGDTNIFEINTTDINNPLFGKKGKI
jgi:hypothetical protein